MKMEFEGLEAARQAVDIVEELETCKMQLEDVERKVGRRGDWVFDKLEDVTMNLANIAHKLFVHSMRDVGLGEGNHNQPPSSSSQPDNEDHEMEDGAKLGENGEHSVRTARICRFGTSCRWRGRCVFYHPEPGMSREKVIIVIQESYVIDIFCWQLLDATPNSTFGSRCERRPFCRFKHPEGNCHLRARGYFKG